MCSFLIILVFLSSLLVCEGQQFTPITIEASSNTMIYLSNFSSSYISIIAEGTNCSSIDETSNDELSLLDSSVEVNLASGAYTFCESDDNVTYTAIAGSLRVVDSLSSVLSSLSPTTACAFGDTTFLITGALDGERVGFVASTSDCSNIENYVEIDGGVINVDLSEFSGSYLLCWASTGNSSFVDQSSVPSLSVSTPLLASLVVENPSSSCAADGDANVSVTSGTGPFTVTWTSGGQVIKTQNSSSSSFGIAGLSPGTYNASISQSVCPSISLVGTVIAPAPLTLTSNLTTPVLCGSDGSISVDVSNAIGAYTVKCNNGSCSNLVAGSYQVTVADSAGCVLNIPSIVVGTITVSFPAAVPAITNVSCSGGSDGAISVASATQTKCTSAGQSSTSCTNLEAGTYDVSVLLVAQSCNSTVMLSSVIVSQPSPIQVAFSLPPFTSSACSPPQQSVVVTATGGTGSLTFALGGQAPASINGSSATFSSVASGEQPITITDSASCSVSSSVTVPAHEVLNVTVSGLTAIKCKGKTAGNLVFNITGGSGVYAVSYVSPASTLALALTAEPDIAKGTIVKFPSVLAGNYSFLVNDSSACVWSMNITIKQPSALVLNYSATNHTPYASGGTPPYTFTNVSYVNGTIFTVVDSNLCSLNRSVVKAKASTATSDSADISPGGVAIAVILPILFVSILVAVWVWRNKFRPQKDEVELKTRFVSH